jgi:hypothetical protein
VEVDTRIDLPSSVPLTVGQELHKPAKNEESMARIRSGKDDFRSFFQGEMDEILIVEGLLSADRIRQISKTGAYEPK